MLAGLGQRRRRIVTPLAGAVLAGALVVLSSGVAFAGPQVSISGTPQNGKAATVSGAGFPSIAKDPTGIQILECSDPRGTVANLPTSAADCDGATQNPLPVNQDAGGSFTTPYTFQTLTGLHGTSNIPCNTTNYCVLWAGVDYNNEFLGGPHAFSVPFEVGKPIPSSSDVAVIAIPIAVVAVLLAGFAVVRRRRTVAARARGPRSPGGRAPASALRS
ncbi:MAG TPA: hypothetical protein VMB82_09905 [Acidimicrobiales bacterium]|nr:hypothetical protein [Acidimicrobiales bacterium]